MRELLDFFGFGVPMKYVNQFGMDVVYSLRTRKGSCLE